MKNLGYLLIAASFLVTSWFASQHPTEMNWTRYVPALAVGVVGVWVARAASRQATREGDRLSGNIAVLDESLTVIVEKIVRFDGEKETLNPYDAHGRIDELFPDDIDRFVEARETIAHVFGLDAYAAVMNEFAAGERYLARVWSASVDGYVDEVRTYIGRAREQFLEARRLFDRYRGEHAG